MQRTHNPTVAGSSPAGPIPTLPHTQRRRSRDHPDDPKIRTQISIFARIRHRSGSARERHRQLRPSADGPSHEQRFWYMVRGWPGRWVHEHHRHSHSESRRNDLGDVLCDERSGPAVVLPQPVQHLEHDHWGEYRLPGVPRPQWRRPVHRSAPSRRQVEGSDESLWPSHPTSRVHKVISAVTVGLYGRFLLPRRHTCL